MNKYQKYSLKSINFTFITIFILVTILYFLRIIIIPDDIILRDQTRVVMYILDAIYNHHWLCQFDGAGNVASKPPLYNWLGAIFVKIFGANRISYTFPAFIGSSIAALVVWIWTYDIIKEEKYSWIALLCYVATPAFNKQLTLIRTDGLFTGLVILTAYFAWKAYEYDYGWNKAWITASFACLTKGPFALILGFGGLISLIFLRQDNSFKKLNKGWWYGILFPILIAGGWAIICLWKIGEPFYKKVFISELFNHAFGYKRFPFFEHLFRWTKPIIYLLTRSLPWTPFFILGILKFIKNKKDDLFIKRGISFILAQIFIGLFFLIIASHKRGDLVFPLLPGVAIIEGITLGEFFKKYLQSNLTILISIIIFIVMFGAINAFIKRKTYLHNQYIKKEFRIKQFANKILKNCNKIPIKYFSSFVIQCYLKKVSKPITKDDALKLISENKPVFIITDNLSGLSSYLSKKNIKYYIILKDKIINLGLISNISKCY